MIDSLVRWLRRTFVPAYGLRNPTNRQRFEAVFRTRRWATGQSVSGPGSDRDSGQVDHSIRMLTKSVDELGVRSIADVPCGDFHWFDLFLKHHPDIDYVGYDIVAPLIARNRVDHPGRRFEVLDITAEVPAAADLVFSKDLVNHLYERDVWAALRNMAASGSRWLMITSNTGAENRELYMFRPGASRELDLQGAPYSLPHPIWSDHYLSVWSAEAVAARVAQHDRETG